MTRRRSPWLRTFTRSLVAALMAVLVAACSTTESYNPTTRNNEIKTEVLAKRELRNVVVAHVNLGMPSRKYVDRSAAMIDGRVTAYLKANGYNVLPQREFSQRWENAKLTYGDPIDPTTGRVNSKTYIQIINQVREEMSQRTPVDAFVFTDLIEHEVIVTNGINHVARFDGVTRKPTLKGPGNGVSTEFDWSQGCAAVSIQINVYSAELEQIFSGIGGIDLTDAIDTRSGRNFVRRKDVLENADFIDQGIQLALHPLIKMDNWPGVAP